MLTKYREHILLPRDHVIARSMERLDGIQIVHGTIPAGFKGLDIGRDTSDGTVDIARAMALADWRGAFTVVEGDDTVAAVRKAEVLETEISHVSTGGGASLKFIGGEELPGITVLSEESQ